MIEFNLNKKRVTDDGYVIRDGFIFEAGNYEDKNFHLTPEELLAASTDFKPVPLNLEHIKTRFDGRLGLLHSIKPSEDAYKLFGEVKLPKCVDESLGDEPIKVSCEWDRENKRLVGLAITTRPRIKDAVLMSAFSETLVQAGKEEKVAFAESLAAFEMEYDTDRTWAGQEILQMVHDRLASAGAICSPSEEAEFISQKEASAIQKMHDLAVKEGKAKCYFVPANYSEKVEKKEMTLVERIKTLFNDALEKAEKDEATVVADDKTVANDGKLQALEAKFNTDLEAFKAEQTAKYNEIVEANNKLQAELDARAQEVEKFSKAADVNVEKTKTEKAVAKVEELITAGKILPAKREKLVAVFTALSNTDDSVKFAADGKDIDVVDVLFSVFEADNSLKEEALNGSQVLNGGQEGDDNSHVERAKAWAKKNYKKVENQ